MLITVHRWFANKSCPGNWLYARLGDLAAKVTEKLGGGTEGATEPSQKHYYRVRKTWADAASQIGAYDVLENAKAMVDQHPGYVVFDWSGNAVYAATVSSKGGMTNADCPFTVKVNIADLNIRKGPGTDFGRVRFIEPGVFTIMEVRSGKGSSAGWGRLKSGIGWISLDFVRRI